MAIWQYSFFIIPKSAVLFDKKMEKDVEGLFDDSVYWLTEPKSCDFFKKLDNELVKGKSWHKSTTLYGEEDSNRLEISCENGLIEFVSLRINFLSEYDHFLGVIIEFCLLNDLIILNQELEAMPLNISQIREMINLSNQRETYERLLSKKYP